MSWTGVNQDDGTGQSLSGEGCGHESLEHDGRMYWKYEDLCFLGVC